MGTNVRFNMPYSLRVEAGHEYTGVAHDSEIDQYLIGSDIEPVCLGTTREGRFDSEWWLVVQDGKGYVVRQERQRERTQVEWLSRRFEIRPLGQCVPLSAVAHKAEPAEGEEDDEGE